MAVRLMNGGSAIFRCCAVSPSLTALTCCLRHHKHVQPHSTCFSVSRRLRCRRISFGYEDVRRYSAQSLVDMVLEELESRRKRGVARASNNIAEYSIENSIIKPTYMLTHESASELLHLNLEEEGELRLLSEAAILRFQWRRRQVKAFIRGDPPPFSAGQLEGLASIVNMNIRLVRRLSSSSLRYWMIEYLRPQPKEKKFSAVVLRFIKDRVAAILLVESLLTSSAIDMGEPEDDPDDHCVYVYQSPMHRNLAGVLSPVVRSFSIVLIHHIHAWWRAFLVWKSILSLLASSANDAGEPPDDPDDPDDQVFVDFKCDIYCHEPLDHPFEATYALRWGPSVEGSKGVNRFYVHGIWPKKLGINNYRRCKSKYLEKLPLFSNNEGLILRYWPDLKKPDSVVAASHWIYKEWWKHGAPARMNLRMYLFFGLAFREALPDDLGIHVGQLMTLKDVSDQVNLVLKKFSLFGRPTGADVFPEIQATIDPNNIGGAFIIKEVRLFLVRKLKEDMFIWHLQQEIGNMYIGNANSATNKVILPRRV